VRRWILPLTAVMVWGTCAVVLTVSGYERLQPGTDRLSLALAVPRQLLKPARDAFMAATAHLPSAGGELIAGLTTGDVSRVSETLVSQMKTASLTHLTAVSGANCHVVVVVVFFALARIGCARGFRIAGSLVALGLFVAFVSPQASVARAVVMAGAVLVGLAVGRLASGIPTLGLSVIILLMCEPRWALDYGFGLSVMATLGLLTLVQPLTELTCSWRLGGWFVGQQVPAGFRVLVAVPLSAAIACQPLLILLQPSLPTYGVFANILCEPVAAFATMSGLVVAAVAPVLPSLASILAWGAWLPAEWIGRVAVFVSHLPLANIGWFDGLLGAGVALVLSALLAIALLKPRFLSPRVRRLLFRIVVGVLIFAATASAGSAVWRQGRIPENWSIAACDVGQGDAFVIRSRDADGNPHFALIDTGRSTALIGDCLQRLGVRSFDFVVLTHWDNDHVGGVRAVMSMTTHLYVIRPADAAEGLLLASLSSRVQTVEFAHAGMHGSLGLSSWQVLWPDQRTPSMQAGNAGSIAMMWNVDGIRMASLADLGEQAQDTLVAHTIDLPSVDVLKIAHHGSADTSLAVTRRLHPAVALIGVGAHNGYGHPTRSVLSSLESLGTEIERTDLNGLIVVARESDRIVVYRDR